MSSRSENYDFHHEDNLDCMCAVASFALREALVKAGIRARVISGDYKLDTHCWVKVGRKIIDLTATQFDDNLPPVLITTDRDKRYHLWEEVKTMEDLGWSFEQNPTKRLINKIIGA